MAALNIPDLAGKAVLITGASTGIGAALARAFAARASFHSPSVNASCSRTCPSLWSTLLSSSGPRSGASAR